MDKTTGKRVSFGRRVVVAKGKARDEGVNGEWPPQGRVFHSAFALFTHCQNQNKTKFCFIRFSLTLRVVFIIFILFGESSISQ